MGNKGKFTREEIVSQPETWGKIIKLIMDPINKIGKDWSSNPKKMVVFTGCGSSYYASLSASSVFQALVDVPTFAFPASELLFFPERVFFQGTDILLVAISRSGETTETIEAVSSFTHAKRGRVIAITCDSASTLANNSDYLIGLDPAQETSIAQTRSLSSMLLSSIMLSGKIGNQSDVEFSNLPKVISRQINQYIPLTKELGENLSFNRFFFLGSGYLHGVAHEAMLKMKEMSLSYSEAFHSLEFRHGPMSMVNDQTVVVGLISESAQNQETAVLKDMHSLGAKIMAITETATDDLNSIGDVIDLATGLPEWARPAAYLPALQMMSYYRSIAKGLDPDNPENLNAVIKLSSIK